MNTRNLIASTGVALLLSGCIPSVNPFYTEKDVIFNERLLGEWRAEDSSDETQCWKFEKSGEQSYQLTIIEEGGKEGTFIAHLFKLKQELFLDLIPSDVRFATNQADLVAFSTFPGHLLVRVSQIEPELKLAFFNFKWLEDHLKENPKALAHHAEGERLLLTADTRALQRFVLKHLGEDELFENPGVMVRGANRASN